MDDKKFLHNKTKLTFVKKILTKHGSRSVNKTLEDNEEEVFSPSFQSRQFANLFKHFSVLLSVCLPIHHIFRLEMGREIIIPSLISVVPCVLYHFIFCRFFAIEHDPVILGTLTNFLLSADTFSYNKVLRYEFLCPFTFG